MTEDRRRWAAMHRATGLCEKCKKPALISRLCFRHTLGKKLSKAGVLAKIKAEPGAIARLSELLEERFRRILTVEGFAVDAIREPGKIIERAGIKWGHTRERGKLLEIMAGFDDLAIRRRFDMEAKAQWGGKEREPINH